MKSRKKLTKIIKPTAILIFWIAVWWILSVIVGKQVLMPSPPAVAIRFIALVQTAEFHISVLASVLRMTVGFFAATAAGIILGVLCARVKVMDSILSPLFSVIKATPVASFIILALVWISKDTIPVFISALMVLPVIHSNVRQGVLSADKDLLEMADIFGFSLSGKIRLIYVPSVMPYLTAGMKTGVGLGWKAGVASEVLCLAAHSIGKHLYNSKQYLETADMFVWTIVVIILSVIIEKLLISGMARLQKKRKYYDKNKESEQEL